MFFTHIIYPSYFYFHQVREPRTELQRYGGEASGIRAGVIKSVKIK